MQLDVYPNFQKVTLFVLSPSLFLSPEVFAAREKNGIYIPRDRYLQEEAEKKVFVAPLNKIWEILEEK